MLIGLAALAIAQTAPTLSPITFGLNLDGSITSPSIVRFRPGSSFVPVPTGVGIHFDGRNSGLMIEDAPMMKFAEEFTISAWIKPEAYVTIGPGAQIFFRGDDRGGLDPYALAILPNGGIYFGITGEANQPISIGTPIELNKWTHILASFSASSQELRLWKNGELAAFIKSSGVKPMVMLDPGAGAGLGLGNIQWDRGPHNQPFTGTIADLRLMRGVLVPTDVGFDPQGWISPWREGDVITPAPKPTPIPEPPVPPAANPFVPVVKPKLTAAPR